MKNILIFDTDMELINIRAYTLEEAKRLIYQYQDYMTFQYHAEYATENYLDFMKNSKYKDDSPDDDATSYVVDYYSRMANTEGVRIDNFSDEDKLKVMSFFNRCYYGTDTNADFFGAEYYYVTCDIMYEDKIPVKLFCLVDWQEDFKEEFPEIWEKIQGGRVEWSYDSLFEDFKEDPVMKMKAELE